MRLSDMKKGLLMILLVMILGYGSSLAQTSTTEQINAANAAYKQAQADYMAALKTYGGAALETQAAAAKMQAAAKIKNQVLQNAPPSTTQSAADTIIASNNAAKLANMGHKICATCAVFNIFDKYFTDYAKQAFTIIGNGVTILIFSFALGIGILKFAMMRLAPHLGRDAGPPVDLVQLLIFIGSVTALRVSDQIVWRVYEAGIEWGSSVSVALIEAGSDGTSLVPPGATSQVAKIVGSAETVLWSFVGFAWEMLKSPNFMDMLTESPGSIVASVVFAVLVLLIYGGLLLYFAFIILQGYIFLVLPIPFGSLIIGAAAFKATRQTTFEAIRLVIFAFFTFVGAGISMGFTAKVLSLSKDVVTCYTSTRDAGKCGDAITPMATALGVPPGALTEAFSSFEMFTILIVIGACCWLVHYLTLFVVAKLTGSQPMGGPLALFAAATAGTIFMGGRAATNTLRAGASSVWDQGRKQMGNFRKSRQSGGGGSTGDGIGENQNPLIRD